MADRRFPLAEPAPRRGAPRADASGDTSHSLHEHALNVGVEEWMKMHGPLFEQYWEQAKQCLGEEEAGANVREFIVKNTQTWLRELDPWVQAEDDPPEGHRVYVTGSDNPRTLDYIYCFCEYAETTKPAMLLDPMIGIVMEADDMSLFHHSGEWCYIAMPPVPGEGLELGPKEKVKCMSARFTLPFVEEGVPVNGDEQERE